MVKLISPLIPGSEDPQLCFSFWYAAFGAGESAVMQISKQDNSSDGAGEKVNFRTSLSINSFCTKSKPSNDADLFSEDMVP